MKTLKICFITNNDLEVETEEGAILLRVSMKNKGGIPFKCGGGFCGTCRCKIEEGKENLASLTKKELKILSNEEIKNNIRLACQTQVNGPLKVSWIPLEMRKK